VWRRRKKSYALRHFYIRTWVWNKNHTPFFPGRHTTTHQLAYLRHAIFPSPANRHIASHTNIMNQLQYREAAKITDIRTRFKSLTTIEQTKLRIFKKILWCSLACKRGKKTPSGENKWREFFYYVLIYQQGSKWTLSHRSSCAHEHLFAKYNLNVFQRVPALSKGRCFGLILITTIPR